MEEISQKAFFNEGFHPRQDLTARVCSDMSSTLSKAGADRNSTPRNSGDKSWC